MFLVNIPYFVFSSLVDGNLNYLLFDYLYNAATSISGQVFVWTYVFLGPALVLFLAEASNIAYISDSVWEGESFLKLERPSMDSGSVESWGRSFGLWPSEEWREFRHSCAAWPWVMHLPAALSVGEEWCFYWTLWPPPDTSEDWSVNVGCAKLFLWLLSISETTLVWERSIRKQEVIQLVIAFLGARSNGIILYLGYQLYPEF